jgi:large subunit ribosomal protein L6
MSKIGKAPITIPEGVQLNISSKNVEVKGPKGTLNVEMHRVIEAKIEDNKLFLTLKDENSENGRAYWGLARALINNAVNGVTGGFIKELELVGVGYRAEKAGNDIKIAIGYSHPVIVKAPEGILFELPTNTEIKISGTDRQLVGQIASNIRDIRRPEPYKGKGIRYKGELVRRKQGKAAKA